MIKAQPDGLFSWSYRVLDGDRHLCTLDLAVKDRGHEEIHFRYEDVAYRSHAGREGPFTLYAASAVVVHSELLGKTPNEVLFKSPHLEASVEEGLWSDWWKMSESGHRVGKVVRRGRALRGEFTSAVDWPTRLHCLAWAMVCFLRNPAGAD